MSGRSMICLIAGLQMVPSLALAQRPATREVVWPLPPEAPRVRFTGQLQTERDIGKKRSFFSRLKSALIGGAPVSYQIQRPHDVYSRDGRRFYVSDGALGKVLVFDSETRIATVLGESGLGALRKPMGLTGDGLGNVFVADASAKRVVAFDAAGNYLSAFGGESVLHNPVDVAVDRATGHVYVADSYLHQVVVFDLADGKLVRRIGRDVGDLAAKQARLRGVWDGSHVGQAADAVAASEATDVPGHEDGTVEPRDIVENRSSDAGEFRYPAFVAVAPDGTLYVSDGMNFRIQAFDAQGQFVREFGKMGDIPGTFARPKGVGVDNEGHVWVADAAFNNVQIFSPQGELLLTLGSLGYDEGEFWLPLGMHVDRQNRIYVADRFNNRIQMFEFIPDRTADGR